MARCVVAYPQAKFNIYPGLVAFAQQQRFQHRSCSGFLLCAGDSGMRVILLLRGGAKQIHRALIG
jgi:hypothetical protein